MEEKTFLKVLRNYFGSKADNEILLGDKTEIIIPMEWMFTERIDKEIIQRAMVQLLIENKPNYIENYVNKRLKSEDKNQEEFYHNSGLDGRKDEIRSEALKKIKDLSLNIGRDGLRVSINGLDNWTKAIIGEKPYKNGKILQISEDEFCERILGVLKADSIQEIVASLGISDEEKTHLQTLFASSQSLPLDQFSLEGIKTNMVEAAKNLTSYYDYLIEEKKYSMIHRITIKQRQGTRGTNKKTTGTQVLERKSPIYPFVERETILRQMNPTHVINVDGIDEDGQIVQNVYTAFMYNDPLEKGGQLLVAEPLEGSHSTRVVYLDEETFKGFEIPEKTNRYEEVSRHYLEMSNEEFSKVPNSVRINHGQLDEYGDKMQFVITGRTSQSVENHKGYYNGILNKVYGQRKLTASDVGKLGEKALSEEEKIANTILDALGMGEKEVGTKE